MTWVKREGGKESGRIRNEMLIEQQYKEEYGRDGDTKIGEWDEINNGEQM